MTDIKSLEHPTLKVPYEILNKKFRIGQKTLDREISHVQGAVSQIEDYIKHWEYNKSLVAFLENLVEYC